MPLRWMISPRTVQNRSPVTGSKNCPHAAATGSAVIHRADAIILIRHRFWKTRPSFDILFLYTTCHQAKPLRYRVIPVPHTGALNHFVGSTEDRTTLRIVATPRFPQASSTITSFESKYKRRKIPGDAWWTNETIAAGARR